MIKQQATILIGIISSVSKSLLFLNQQEKVLSIMIYLRRGITKCITVMFPQCKEWFEDSIKREIKVNI